MPRLVPSPAPASALLSIATSTRSLRARDLGVDFCIPSSRGLAQRSVRPEDRGSDQGLKLFLAQALGLAIDLAEVGPNS
jgi:hypothetical protein